MKRTILVWLILSVQAVWAQPRQVVISQIKALIAQGEKAESTHDNTRAIGFYQQALNLSHKAQLPAYSILLCVDIGILKSQLTQVSEALTYLRRANEYYHTFREKSVRRRFMIDYSFAIVHIGLTQLDSATHYFNQCSYLIKTHNDSLKSFNHYLDLYYLERSYLAQETMNFTESIALNEEAIRRYKARNKTDDGSGNHYNSLGKSYAALGQFARADSAFSRAATLYASTPLFEAIILCNLTDSQVQQGRASAGAQTLQRAQQAYKRYQRQTGETDADVERRLRQNRAGVYLAQGNLPRAEAAFNELLTFCAKYFPMPSGFRVDAYLSMSRLYEQQRNPAAVRKALDAAVREAYGPRATSPEQAVLPRSLVSALTARADFLARTPAPSPTERAANAREALTTYEQAIDLVASLRRGALLPESKAFLAAKAAPLFEPALSLCYELAQQPTQTDVYTRKAFALFDRFQNSLLADAQLEQRLMRQYLPAPMQAEWRRLSQRLSQLRLVRETGNPATEAELNQTEKSLIEWQQRTDRTHPQYRQALSRVTQLSMTDYQTVLQPGEALLCYAPTPAGLLVLALHKRGALFRRLPVSPAGLDQALSRYRAEVSRNPGIVGSYDNRPGQAVYKLLLAPIRAQLPDLTALTVVPPPNWQIPFEALETQAGRWLLQDVDVGYQFNLSGRLLPPDPVQTRHEALSFAPFAADTGRSPFRMPNGFLLRSLRASAEEATLPDGQSWLGKAASKQRFLEDAQHTRLLLVTTHTYPGPRETALVFHPAETDYLLYPSELQHADLRSVGLAALSACATEKGVQLPGDGVHSLGRAMAWAGAQSVTCSWFNVNDEAQALLARHFFPKLNNGQSIRENWRQARLEFLASPDANRYSGHPHWWAGVALYGGHTPFEPESASIPGWLIGLLAGSAGISGWRLLSRKDRAKKSGL
ncbi:CHAT domain-containing protein [Rudanella paleaurantiibacter]|nr:CHAT domain-containing protein [Rudanella paleaurantiibacter]